VPFPRHYEFVGEGQERTKYKTKTGGSAEINAAGTGVKNFLDYFQSTAILLGYLSNLRKDN